MPAAGSGQLAIALESDGFFNLPDIPTWFQPGEGLEVGDATLDRQMSDNPQHDDPRGDGQIAGNLNGTFSVSFTYAGTNWHDLVFPATSPVGLATDGGLAPTATIYLRSELDDGTTQERFLAGAAVESFTLNYTEGEVVTVDLTFRYFDEPEVGGTHGSAPADGDIQTPAKTDIVHGNAFDVQFSGASVANLQSASFEVGSMISPKPQQDDVPTDVSVGDYDQTGSITAILSDNGLREATYGSDTAVEPLSTVDETTATITAEARDGTTDTYNLTRVQPTDTNWQNVLSGEQTTNPTSISFVDMTVA